MWAVGRGDATLAAVAFPPAPPPELLAVHLQNGRHLLSRYDRESGALIADLPLPGDGSISAITNGADPAELLLTYTDAATPPTPLRYRAGRTWLLPAPPVTGTPVTTVPRVTCRRVAYTSSDGTAVGMSVLTPGHASDADGAGDPHHPAPTLLLEYGGFGLPSLSGYQPEFALWVAAGGVVAIAGVRGGGDHGDAWHRAGARANKQNAVDDLHAAARWLTGHGYATPAQLGVIGASHAGLLVGAAITQHPGLYRAAVCVAPVLDLIRYELAGLGPAWRAEFGTVTDPADFGHLLACSPYHRVRDGVTYPPTLLIAGAADRRVDPMHARKMCAALQHAAPHEPILLRTVESAGHLGSDQAAVEALAFLARQTGLDLSRTWPPGCGAATTATQNVIITGRGFGYQLVAAPLSEVRGPPRARAPPLLTTRGTWPVAAGP